MTIWAGRGLTVRVQKLGAFARVLYFFWFGLIAIALWIGMYATDRTLSDIPDDLGYFFWFVIIFVSGVLLIYLLLAGLSFITESESYRSWFSHGQGGSARWGGPLAFYRNAWFRASDAPIYLGRTLHKFDPWPFRQHVGIDDENHMVTIAQNGSGKSTTAIWPTLALYPYPDSVFVLDPKGEHAQLTAVKRSRMKFHKVFVLDPFDITKGFVTQGFNPLSEIDTNSPRAKEDIKAIADGCVVPSSGQKSDTGAHFEKLQRAMLAGIIAHVMTTEPESSHNLPTVYDRFLELSDAELFEGFIQAMRRNNACGNLPREAALMYDNAGRNERGSIFTTTLSNIEWISSPGMRAHLLKSDLRLSELRTARTTVYVVLDLDAMKPDRQGRYMRTLTSLAFEACRKNSLPKRRAHHRTLFILDEVAQLGPMPMIEEAYRTLRGSHVKIWTFFQTFSALSENFRSADDLMGNSTKQFFGCGDTGTAEVIQKYLGEYRDAGGRREYSRSLLDVSEIQDTLRQHKQTQIVITGGGDRMQLTRERYIPSTNT